LKAKHDAAVVPVHDGNMTKAIRVLNESLGTSGTFRLLKMRAEHPSRNTRQRAKRQLVARQRFKFKKKWNKQ